MIDTAPRYDHLVALTDHNGIFEHALHDLPRPEHGYCVDDVARGLIVAVREPDQTPVLERLTETYLRFLERALGKDGLFHNRMDSDGEWVDSPGLGDWWGRSVWALGTAAASAPLELTRKRAMRAFHIAAARRSPAMHAMAFAALGAAEVAKEHPRDDIARNLLRAAIAAVPVSSDSSWPWPETRLRYGNASIAEALFAAGVALDDSSAAERGITLLRFLLGVESVPGYLSVTGSSGRGQGEAGPLFDQQPIEIAAMADACARAYETTADLHWLTGVRMAWEWFEGINDGGILMFDCDTGAGFDGLELAGRNDNRGAESTLAALSTYQRARRLPQVNIGATSR